MWVRLIPVADSASWLDLESCNMSPNDVIWMGPLIPFSLTAAVTLWATLNTFAPAGNEQFSKSHHTETLTSLLSSSRFKWNDDDDDDDEDEDDEDEEWNEFEEVENRAIRSL